MMLSSILVIERNITTVMFILPNNLYIADGAREINLQILHGE